jgi:DNA-binding transcriptional ArsR family regulator
MLKNIIFFDIVLSTTLIHPLPMTASHHAAHLAINPELLRSAAVQAVGVLKLLANEDRLLLLCQLSQGEHCVSELEEELGIVQPTLSQQLGVLRNEGVVTTRRQGKNIYYSVADPRTLEILMLLHRLYCPEGKV